MTDTLAFSCPVSMLYTPQEYVRDPEDVKLEVEMTLYDHLTLSEETLVFTTSSLQEGHWQPQESECNNFFAIAFWCSICRAVPILPYIS